MSCFSLTFVLLLNVFGSVNCGDFYIREFSVPLKIFDGNLTYACLAQPISADQFLVEFEPRIQKDVIKHMSVFVCDEPGTTDPIWDCLQPRTVCESGKESLYAWTNYAPGLKLPQNAGMHTGNRQRYIVFQMHGPSEGVRGPAAEKIGGMAITVRSSRPAYNVALAIVGSTGIIPPLVRAYKTDSSCVWNITRPAPIFGYALHSHLKGRTVSGYIIRNGKWIEIGKGDPRYPITFFDVTHRHMYLQYGDIIVVRCTFVNPSSHFIKFGHSQDDEMCNVFIHYGIALDAPAEDRSYICSNDATTYHWRDHFKDIPSDSTDISGDTEQRRLVNSNKDFIIKY